MYFFKYYICVKEQFEKKKQAYIIKKGVIFQNTSFKIKSTLFYMQLQKLKKTFGLAVDCDTVALNA